MTSPAPAARRSRTREGVALILIALASLLFQQSATRSWAEATTADGTRYEVSPIGLAHFAPGATAPTTECRWWPRVGNAALCAPSPGAEARLSIIRRAYPMVVSALWVAVLALFLNALRIPRQLPAIGVLATMASVGTSVLALLSLASGAGALSALAGLELQRSALGFTLVAAGTACVTAASVLQVASGRFSRGS